MEFIYGVILGFVAGLIVTFFVWRNNKKKLEKFAVKADKLVTKTDTKIDEMRK